VELMIVVAIIGILAAVAVPYYQRYVAKSRLTSLVIPGIHAIENTISTRYAVKNEMPGTGGSAMDLKASDTLSLAADADLQYLNALTWTPSTSQSGYLSITVSNTNAKFKALETRNQFRALATATGGKLYWTYGGTLSDEFGL
jgi:type IV pilus assembly protein PilA